MRLLSCALTLAAAGSVLAPVPVTAAPPLLAASRIAWSACPDAKGFQCATLEVPTDYDDPGGATTTIALTRLPATRPAERLGSLFVNPGGPGGSGVDFVQQQGRTTYDASVRRHYDIVGFDPRAVGASDPATCYPSAEAEAAALSRLPAFPVTPADARRYLRLDRALTTSCRQTSSGRISHSSTANVARDLDVLRAAVGDRRLNYVGYSYGTYLGATYAELFPQRVGRFVLDGTLDPPAYSGSNGDRRPVVARTGQGAAAAEVFGQFLRLCREAGDRCALNALGVPSEVVRRTFDSLRTTPVDVPVGDGTTVPIGYQEAVVLAFQSMYEPATWGDLATTLTYLARSDRRVSAPVQQMVRAAGPALRAAPQDYPSVGGSLASVCVDTTSPLPPEGFQALADAEDAAAPDFGRYRAWTGLECTTLGITDTDSYTGPWQQTTRAPVLVIGTRHDPATPYPATRPYADRFPRASMITVEGYGHTTAFNQSRCADQAIASYLVGGVQPVDGSTCAQDVMPFAAGSGADRGLPREPLSLRRVVG